MDVKKLILCLQSGSDDAKNKLMLLLNNIKSVIDAEPSYVPRSSNLHVVDQARHLMNGNNQSQSLSSMACLGQRDEALINSGANNYRNLHVNSQEDSCFNGNKLDLGIETDTLQPIYIRNSSNLHVADQARHLMNGNNQSQSLSSMACLGQRDEALINSGANNYRNLHVNSQEDSCFNGNKLDLGIETDTLQPIYIRNSSNLHVADQARHLMNGNNQSQSLSSMACLGQRDLALIDSGANNYRNLHVNSQEDSCFNGNKLDLGMEIDTLQPVYVRNSNLHVVDQARHFMIGNNQSQSLSSMACLGKRNEALTDPKDNNYRNLHVLNQEVDFKADEFDDIIEYDPFSDDEAIIDEEKALPDHTTIVSADGVVSKEAYSELKDVFDRFIETAGRSSECLKHPVEMDSVVQSDGTLEVKEVTSGSASDKKPRPKIGPCDESEMSIQTSKVGPGSQQHKFKSGSCDKSKMTIQTSDQPKKDKKNCCPYCFKLQSKLARHIIASHNNQTDVKDLLKFPKDSKERKAMLDLMKKKGNYEFNTNANLNNGQLIVSRRPNPQFHRSASDYSICHSCLGTYSKTCTRQHVCSKKTVKGDRSSINLGRMVEGRVHTKASESLQIVLSVLNEDHITNLIKYDWLLISFGNELCEQYDVHYQHNMIRNRLRLLSRVLNELKKIELKVTNFASVYNSQLCDSVIEAIRMVGGFDSANRLFGAPSSASNAVTQVKRVGRILRDECIANKDKELKEQTDDFICLFTSRAAYKINKLVMNTVAKMKREKIEILPTTDDINQFRRFLDQKRKEYFELLNEGFSLEKWINLSEVTMASMLLFSRRRTGEMQNTIVSDYVGRERRTEKNRDQLFLALTDEGKKRVQRYNSMKIRGKKGRTVPILLQHDVERCMDLILNYREAAGVSSKNQLLFALPSSNPDKPKVIDACAILRKLSVASGAVNPETLRGTKFRKHFATFCATKEVNDNTVTDVASFMGHSVQIHNDIYRGNILNREIAQMSELLEEASGKCEENVESEILGEICHHATATDDLNVEPSRRKVQSVKNKIASKRRREPETEDEFVAKKISRKRYTPEEKVFHNHLKNGTVPSNEEIEAQQDDHPVIKNRSCKQLKNWINNRKKGKLISRKTEKK